MEQIKPQSKRLYSLDALRGFDMIWIMGLGYGLKLFAKEQHTPFWDFIYLEFHHSDWFGLVFWDLIFPLFIFIAGVATPFSVGKHLSQGISKSSLLIKALKRAILLYILGFLLANNGIQLWNLSEARFTGDLAKIGFSYFFGVAIYLYASRRWQVIWLLAILTGYWLLLKFTSAPGYPPGDLSQQGNFISHLERSFMPGKLSRIFYDQSGFFNNVNAIPNMLGGVLTGTFLMSVKYNENKKTVYMLLAGAVCVLLGWLWNLDSPFSESLWTSSFALATIGWSLILMAIFYFIIDVKGYKKWAFFLKVIGMNPILIYVSPFFIDWDFTTKAFMGWAIDLSHKEWVNLVYWTAQVGIKWMFLYFLYKKKAFLRV
ncbi:MAG TPA: DUF5009 domain-containing protein [Agriterribacter sp.]|nr:DUF5009 domain-containing protein [Chitinophagaceae bacterium]HRP33322.1 DUF5009 domain-containing protein [Agriterribacter sp.]